MLFRSAILSKRRRAKKTRLRNGGSLSLAEAQALQDQKELDGQIKQEIKAEGGRVRRAEPRQRRCGVCGQIGHNLRTCKVKVKTFKEEDFK